jgi:hypothetical protein
MDTPTIWVEATRRSDGKWFPVFDFGSVALHGALDLGYFINMFEDVDRVPGGPEHVIIGCVETTVKYMQAHGIAVPQAIDMVDQFKGFTGRRIWAVDSVESFLSAQKALVGENPWPVFAKPHGQIKAFTGTVLTSQFDAELVLKDYTGPLMLQEVVDFASEWRLYVDRGKIVALKHYKGDSMEYPLPWSVETCFKYAEGILPHLAYTLDFGVIKSSNPDDTSRQTVLIEPNDMWAIGCYGLEPRDYVKACVSRWVQMTQYPDVPKSHFLRKNSFT